MITKKDITVIVPVHEWDDTIKDLFTEAVRTIPHDVNVIFITPNGSGLSIDNDTMQRFTHASIKFVNDGNSSFQHMVNEAVKEVTTDWFSILEFDDEYSPIWFYNFIKYQEYNQQYNFFLPMNDLYNVEGGKYEFIGNGNEAVWASSFSEEIGVIDEKSLEDYFDFYLTGGIFNTKAWNKVGGLKESIKVTFWYEFMLRAAHKGEKFYVVPKIGYTHVLGRDGSLLMNYRKTVDTKEADFWFKLAKKESFFDTDRNKTYDKKNSIDEEIESDE